MRIAPRFSIAFGPLLACLFLAVALWLYASMREEYSTILDIPLDIRLPEGRALEAEPSPVIRARVQGAGWQLVNHFVSSAIRCVVDVPALRIAQAQAQTGNPNQVFIPISRQMLSQAIQAPVGVLVQRVVSDSLTLAIGFIAQKRIPIRAVLDVEPREGFVVTMPYHLTPDSVTIRSSKTMLARISAWQTEPISRRDVYEPITAQTELADTLTGVVQFPKLSVSCDLNVQQMAELLVEDVPVSILGYTGNKNILPLPTRVAVLLRGGINDIAQCSPEQIRVSIDYAQLRTNTTGLLKPSVSAPSGINAVHVQPRNIRVVERTRKTSATPAFISP
ncbi:MAG: hypothetical protein EAZ92_00430 [Candidatus Kapaibacterium sp.]|nr:MAG: hypothetical protein EAZ92_00430 [Candidatus Kapabacteria bacterium]